MLSPILPRYFGLCVVSCGLVTGFATGCSDTAASNNGKNAVVTKIEGAPAVATGEALRERLDKILDSTERRNLNSQDHAAWQVFHAILAFGRRSMISHDGKLVPSLEYLLDGGKLRGWNVKAADKGVHVLLEAGSKTGQGHKDQWLGYLATCDLRADDPVMVDGKKRTIHDMVTQAQWECTDTMEATWTLMGLYVFLPLDAKWQAKDGGEWTFDRLMAMEAGQDINSSSCGGSHRLTALSMVLNKYLETHPKGQPLSGGWAAADAKIRWAVEKAREYQQPDGSFSVMYFQRPSHSPDIAQRIGTTGHTLEFLTFALSDEELQSPWMTRAVEQMVTMLENTQDLDIECGALYHAAHGLQIYRLRRFGLPSEPAAAGAAEASAVGASGK